MNATQTHSKTFGFTSYASYELHKKVCLFYQVEDWVQAHFTLSHYTAEVKKLNFALDINPADVEQVLRLRSRYAWKKKRLELFGKVPYQKFIEADEREALRLMCESYLETIRTIPTLRGMKKVPFDVPKLFTDLTNLFSEKNWI